MLDIDPAFEKHKLEKVQRHKAMKHGVCTLFNRQAAHNLQMLDNGYEKKQKSCMSVVPGFRLIDETGFVPGKQRETSLRDRGDPPMSAGPVKVRE